MLTFLFFSALFLVAIALGGVFIIPLLAVGALIWLVTLPFRLGFALIGGVLKLVFGLVGGVIGLLLAPFVLVVVGVAMLGALAVGALALLAPLVPIALLALIGWGIYRLMRPNPYPVA